MIIDITGTILMPGNNGNDCPGNGEHYDKNGNLIGICCDECDFYVCCMSDFDMNNCKECRYTDCSHAENWNG